MICLQHHGKLFNIPQEPFETMEESYKRAWFIINNYNKMPFSKLYSLSIMIINKNKGMIYL
jgi:hypothetical protein